MAETIIGLLDADGVLVDVIVVKSDNQAAALLADLADPAVDTPPHLAGVKASVDLAGAKDASGSPPGIGHRRAGGRWSAPKAPVPVPEVLSAEAKAAAAARADDDAFVAATLTRLRKGGGQPLTQAERDRLDVIRLSRT